MYRKYAVKQTFFCKYIDIANSYKLQFTSFTLLLFDIPVMCLKKNYLLKCILYANKVLCLCKY